MAAPRTARPRAVAAVIAAATWLATAAHMEARVHAQELQRGRTALIGAVGWPRFWAEVRHAARFPLELGLRGAVLYGSPVMGLGRGVGGEVGLHVRAALLTREDVVLALRIAPSFFVGDNTLAGHREWAGAGVGYGAQLDIAGLAALPLTDAVVMTCGVSLVPALVASEDMNGAGNIVAGAAAHCAVSAAVSSDTTLFAELGAGYGLAPPDLFDGHEILRVAVGIMH